MRTPLAAILGFAELLSTRARPDQVAAPGHIKGGGKRLLATLDNLFDLPQIEDRTLRVRSVDLGTTLQHAVADSRPMASDKEISLILAPIVPPPPRVLADGWALRRIIDNLVGNGIKFTEEGGTVEASLRQSPEGALRQGVAPMRQTSKTE